MHCTDEWRPRLFTVFSCPDDAPCVLLPLPLCGSLALAGMHNTIARPAKCQTETGSFHPRQCLSLPQINCPGWLRADTGAACRRLPLAHPHGFQSSVLARRENSYGTVLRVGAADACLLSECAASVNACLLRAWCQALSLASESTVLSSYHYVCVEPKMSTPITIVFS